MCCRIGRVGRAAAWLAQKPIEEAADRFVVQIAEQRHARQKLFEVVERGQVKPLGVFGTPAEFKRFEIAAIEIAQRKRVAHHVAPSRCAAW